MTVKVGAKLKLSKVLLRLGACQEAREWAEDFSDGQAAWDACPRGDWMLWLLAAAAAEAAAARRNGEAKRAEKLEAKARELRAEADRLWDDYWNRRGKTVNEVRARWADVVREHYPKAPTAPVEA